MRRSRRLSDSEVIDKTSQDNDVLSALDDLIRAMFVHGRDKVSSDTLMDVVALTLEFYATTEVEEEGL